MTLIFIEANQGRNKYNSFRLSCPAFFQSPFIFYCSEKKLDPVLAIPVE